jgi:Na+/H+ antiporter NhaC
LKALKQTSLQALILWLILQTLIALKLTFPALYLSQESGFRTMKLLLSCQSFYSILFIMNNSGKQASLIQALIPIIFLITFLVFNVLYFGDHTLDGANQLVLTLAAAIAGVIAIRLGYSWVHVRSNIVRSISSAMPSILILLLIGALAGTWMISGVVPAMIYYGLKIFHPSIFLFATISITAIVSMATGSSWSTIATIGIALIGIGKTLGISEGIIAGAIISGAYLAIKCHRFPILPIWLLLWQGLTCLLISGI